MAMVVALAALALVAVPDPADAQAGVRETLGRTPPAAPVLTLDDALRLADRRAFPNRDARADADAAHAAADGARRGILPALSAEAGVVHTTDPIGAFGLLLKQRGVSQASFAPDVLNHPDGITNYGAGLVLEQPLVNPDAWMGLRSARAVADAADAGARWSLTSVRADIVQAYFGAIVAVEMARAVAVAERAALEHVRSAEAAAANGFVTRSDVLLARVRAGDVTSQRMEADSHARTAHTALAVALGAPADSAFALPGSLPSPDAVRALVPQAMAAGNRDDVAAARAATTAARLDYRRAEGTLLPRLNGFARYDWSDAGRVGGGTPSLTVGAAASWSFFGGGREIADARGAAARLRRAEANAEGAEAAAALERESADEAFTVALARAAIADTAVLQAGEALRIVRRKYDGGLSAVSELLTAAAADMQARVSQADSRYRVLAAAAARLRAWGADPAVLATLDSDPR